MQKLSHSLILALVGWLGNSNLDLPYVVLSTQNILYKVLNFSHFCSNMTFRKYG